MAGKLNSCCFTCPQYRFFIFFKHLQSEHRTKTGQPNIPAVTNQISWSMNALSLEKIERHQHKNLPRRRGSPDWGWTGRPCRNNSPILNWPSSDHGLRSKEVTRPESGLCSLRREAWMWPTSLPIPCSVPPTLPPLKITCTPAKLGNPQRTLVLTLAWHWPNSTCANVLALVTLGRC